MLQTVLTILNYGVLLFFGIYVSAAFVNIEFTKKNILILCLFGAADFGLQLFINFSYGIKYAQMLYPLMTHLPVLLLFIFCFKRKILPSLFAIFSAYLYCQIGKWVGLVVFSASNELWITYAARIAITVPVWYVIIRFAAKPLHVIITKSTKILLIFGLLPIGYYLFDYIANVYTRLLYNGSQVIFEFLPFILCIAYLLFCVIYFREYEEKCEAEQQKKLIEIQTAHSLKEIEEIKHSKYEISLIRHDMRHFLSNVSAMIKNKDYEKAQNCIHGIIEVIDQTVMRKYCENEIVNMILCSYESKMADKGIRFDASVTIPAMLPCSDLTLTSILSNGLENAINAVSGLEEDKKIIGLKLSMKSGKLLLSIHNAYSIAPMFIDGLPVTNENGHGLGTQSIQYLAKKLNGNCQFTAENGMFTLRVVL